MQNKVHLFSYELENFQKVFLFLNQSEMKKSPSFDFNMCVNKMKSSLSIFKYLILVYLTKAFSSICYD